MKKHYQFLRVMTNYKIDPVVLYVFKNITYISFLENPACFKT